MSRDDPQPPSADRDGTSQADRIAAALRPDYVAVDERSIADLVTFAREYSKELRYFDLDDQVAGDWSHFVPEGLTAAEIEEFADDPGRFSPNDHPELFRPHFMLFLTFLKLIERCQGELNTFTSRHLDHYFRTVLGMKSKPPAADSVDVILELSPTASTDVQLPAGSLLSAGPDSLGRMRTYATDRELIVNHAQVDTLSTVHVERRITGLEQTRDEHRTEPRRRAGLAMLRLAFGDPAPGDPLPVYPGSEAEPDDDLLGDLKDLVGFSESSLRIKLFELQDLIELKRRRDVGAEWDDINGYLTALASSNGIALTIDAPRDFDANLRAAVGGRLPDFAEINEVDTVYDLLDFSHRQDVKLAIVDELGFQDVNDFTAMMQTKVRVDNDWSELNTILDIAGRRYHGNAAYELDRQHDYFDATAFERNVRDAIGETRYPGRIDPPEPGSPASDSPWVALFDAYDDALVDLESYFSMRAGEFLFVMQVIDGDDSWTDTEEEQAWSKVDAILADAHRSRIYAGRRAELAEIREQSGVDTMLNHVLGRPPSSSRDPVTGVEPFLGDPGDISIIEEARAGGDDVDWNHLYLVAEIAQRNREGLLEPSPERREWVDLDAAADATAGAVPMGTEGALTRWPTFGRISDSSPAASPPVIGWAISSPILFLAEGERVIELTLGLTGEPKQPEELARAFQFEISTAEGWTPVVIEPRVTENEPDAVSFGPYGRLGWGDSDSGGDLADLPAVRFRMVLDQQFAPITALPEDQQGLGTTSPVLRMTLRRSDPDGRFGMSYRAVADLRLKAALLKVGVRGLAALRLRNDDAEIDPSAPFEPFSRSPSIGSRFLIGHPELATKALDTLSFRFEWMGAPTNLTRDYYTNYPNWEERGRSTFSTDIGLVDRRKELALDDVTPLFAGSSAAQRIDVEGGTPGALPAAATVGDLTSWDRYLSWTLGSPDFQHGAYPQVSSRKSMEMAAAIARNKVIQEDGADGAELTVASFQVNPPYTPKMKDLRVDYTSSVEFRLDRPGAGPDKIFHLHPFGYSALEHGGDPGGVSLVPRYENEGELYIGLRGLRSPQTVALLFQMAEGSGDPDLESATVHWSYASGGQWLSLDDGSVLMDTTRGLISSGIVQLALGEADPATLLADDLYWLRAVVSDNSASVADTVAIHTQAVSATFVDSDNAPDHYARPLPAGSITKTISPVAGLAGIHQPYTSHGGRVAEEADRFATRVSERLRHKQRALTMWDYEHLALEQFPQLFKVKCVPADLHTVTAGPGGVDLIVIPDIRDKLPFNSFEPKASPELLAEIHDHLSALAPATAALTVKNAHFRAVKAGFSVRFSGRGNDESYKQRLTEELHRFLSPWAYDEGVDIVIDSRIYATSLVNFIDRRPYVDYVTDLRLFYSDDGDRYELAPGDASDDYHVAAGRIDGVIRAAPEHEILAISEEGYRTELATGIGFMKVDLNLIVG